MWERGWSFIKKAGTVILLSSMVIWAGSTLGFVDGAFAWSTEMPLDASLLGILASFTSWIFAPIGFGSLEATVATLMGLLAKEEIVAVLSVLDYDGFTQLSAYSFLLFNLLCAPCFAALGAIKREMNSAKWTAFAIAYQCVYAYCVSFVVYQIGMLMLGNFGWHILGGAVACAIMAFTLYMLIRRPSDEVLRIRAGMGGMG